jgi:catechol 2,3-dioxygenase-like lactoylglutathione lyase family enzyme
VNKKSTVMTLNKSNQNVYIEHANITVNDMKESVNFFKTAFPHFSVRGGDLSQKEWLHLGDDYTYIALQQAVEDLGNRYTKNYDKIGINHIAFVVSNIVEVTDRLLKAGYKRSYDKAVEKFRIRDYFFDKDGNEFEFIEYLSTKIEERNSFNN